MRGRRIHGAALMAIALGASACGLTHMQDLRFRVDERLHFVAPPDRALVAAPLTVRWTIKQFRVEAPGSAPPTPDAGYFAVFVDRQPVRPDQTMRAVAANDEQCLHQRGCPDPAYLAARQIYTTTDTHLTIPQIPPLAGTERVQLHAIVVVLMDTSGHRIGESAWELDLRMQRAGL
ncbi:MAG TPA: hypothetical protein VFA11_01035 [Acidimicrobiales bacterium]|nr:hypothetical protein [Acidimicrobiales bacterium]